MNRELKAVYCVSDLFAEPCAVSMASLFENNREFEQITVFVIQDGMTQENQERLKKQEKYRQRMKKNTCEVTYPVMESNELR